MFVNKRTIHEVTLIPKVTKDETAFVSQTFSEAKSGGWHK